MMTEDDFYAVAKSKPDVIRVFCKAVNAVIDMRKEAAAGPSDPWAGVRLKEKQDAATQLMGEFADRFVADGAPLSEDEKKLVQSWILRAAKFHLQQSEKQKEAGGNAAETPTPSDIEVAA